MYNICVRDVADKTLLAPLLPNADVGNAHIWQIKKICFDSHSFQQPIQLIDINQMT